MSFDILTYALLRKQIAQGGIQNIEFQNGNLVFTLSDGSTRTVPLSITYDPESNSLTFQDKTVFLSNLRTSNDGTALSFQTPEGNAETVFLPNLRTNETGSILTFQDAAGAQKSLPVSNLRANEDGTALYFYDAATGLPRTIQTQSETFFSVQDGKLCVTFQTET